MVELPLCYFVIQTCCQNSVWHRFGQQQMFKVNFNFYNLEHKVRESPPEEKNMIVAQLSSQRVFRWSSLVSLLKKYLNLVLIFTRLFFLTESVLAMWFKQGKKLFENVIYKLYKFDCFCDSSINLLSVKFKKINLILLLVYMIPEKYSVQNWFWR